MSFHCQKLFLSSAKPSERLDGFCTGSDAQRAASPCK
nr:MAG TPA: hypothetical protein [Caudoviricetes sp.]